MAERYEIIKKLAQGGFGSVYAAKDCMLGRMVAIKRLLPADQSASSDIASATFGREATTLAALQHPNIVQIYDYDMDEDGSFVVMELLDGETLGEMLHRGPMSMEDFLQLARQILEAIGAAHEKGIVHRDLKSDNIFLHRPASGGWTTKVLDFGLAKFSQQPSKQTIDQKGNIMGSIYFLAPEQFRREALDHRADIYSLGCVFYRTLAGEYPFQGDTVFATMDAHIQHKVLPLREYRPDVPPALEAWIMRLISRDPGDRPSDAHVALTEFYAAVSSQPSLAGLVRTEVAAAPAPSPPTAPQSPPVPQAPQRSGPQAPPRSGPQAPPRTGLQSPSITTRSAPRGTPSAPLRPVPGTPSAPSRPITLPQSTDANSQSITTRSAQRSAPSRPASGTPSAPSLPITLPQPTDADSLLPESSADPYFFLQGNRPTEPNLKKPAGQAVAKQAVAKQAVTSKAIPPTEKKGKGKILAIIGVALASIAAGGYFYLSNKTDGSSATGGSTSTSAGFNLERSLTLEKYDLPNEDFISWRVNGGVGWYNRGNDGKGYRRESEEKGLIHSWKNIAQKSGDGWFEPATADLNQSGVVSINNNGGLNGYYPYLFFSGNAGMTHKFLSSEQEKTPGSKKTPAANIGAQGATIFSIFRAGGNRPGQSDMHLLGIRAQTGSDAMELYFNEKQGVYYIRTAHGGKTVDSRLQSDELKGASWCVACATWDTVKGEGSIKVRTPKGNVITGNSTNLPGPSAPLNTINIGYRPPPAGQKATEADKPFADIMEVAVYNIALSKDLQNKVMNSMWDHYFKK